MDTTNAEDNTFAKAAASSDAALIDGHIRQNRTVAEDIGPHHPTRP